MSARLATALALVLVLSGCKGQLQGQSWGLDAIDAMSTPADPPFACGLQLPADPDAAARASCSFEAGSTAADTLGLPRDVAAQIPIRHVIVLMKENRSFDHLLGRLHDQGQPDAEAVPSTYVNPDWRHRDIPPFASPTTCLQTDPDHQSGAVTFAVAGGAMNGFVKSAAASTDTDGHFVMGEYDDTQLPFYYWLANTYALADRDFAPMQSGTFANRNFLLFGTNAGVVDTGISFPSPQTPSIFQTLMAAGFTWGAYSDGSPFSGTLAWSHDDPGVHPFKDFLKALDDGTLPNVAFVDGVDNVEDDHPPADVQRGEAWVKEIYDHAVKSPQWPRLAIVWTYDEAGNFADHVPPPNGCLAAPSQSPFVERGPRVPLVMISPWARRHFVSHVPRDHTAITRFIETVFGLPALTGRDANSDALLDLLDFSCERDLSAPPPPDAGTGGCH